MFFFKMPTQCIISGCKSQYGKHIPKESAVSMHRFPTDPKIKEQWIEIVSKHYDKPVYSHQRNHRVCALHFPSESFIDGDLKWRSVPTVFGIRYETSEDSWLANPELACKVLQNNAPVTDDISRACTQPDSNHSSPEVVIPGPSKVLSTGDNMLEERVDDPDPSEQQVFSSPIASKDKSTYSTDFRTGVLFPWRSGLQIKGDRHQEEC